MTLLDRALTKAYTRRTSRVSEPVQAEGADAAVRGWATLVRQPRRPRGESEPLPVAAHRLDASHVTPPAHVTIAEPEAAPPVSWSWPEICERLLRSSAGPGFHEVADLLRNLPAAKGFRTLAFTGPDRQTGRTSVLATLARVLAEDPHERVLLVDADFRHPQLAALFSLTPGAGLWEAARSDVPISRAVMTLAPRRLCLLPLMGRVSISEIDATRSRAIRTLLRAVRDDFDLVLIDAGPWESLVPTIWFEPPAVDALVGIVRHGHEPGESFDARLFEQASVPLLGVIETFAPQATPVPGAHLVVGKS